MTLFLGPEKEPIQVDKSIISKHIPYFHSLFADQPKDTDVKIELPDIEPNLMKILISWLYDGRSLTKLPAGRSTNYTLVLKLFLLAEHWKLGSLERLCYRALHLRILELHNIKACYLHWLIARDSEIRFLMLVRLTRVVRRLTAQTTGFELLKENLKFDVDFLTEALIYGVRVSSEIENFPPSTLDKFREVSPMASPEIGS